MIVSSRDALRKQVYGPDHSLPSMSIEEYLQEEEARGGIATQARQNSARSGPDSYFEEREEHEEREETARKEAIRWDEYAEANPKGAGNTMNRG